MTFTLTIRAMEQPYTYSKLDVRVRSHDARANTP